MLADADAADRCAEFFVGLPVAVVVEAIADLVGSAGGGVACDRSSFDAVWLLVLADADAADRCAEFFVGVSVAVVVEAIADLVGSAGDEVACDRSSFDAVWLLVLADADAARCCAEFFVGLSVAVVVEAIADLVGCAEKWVTFDRLSFNAVWLLVLADTEAADRCAEFFVSLSVAVVVEAVADLVAATGHGVAFDCVAVHTVGLVVFTNAYAAP